MQAGIPAMSDCQMQDGGGYTVQVSFAVIIGDRTPATNANGKFNPPPPSGNGGPVCSVQRGLVASRFSPQNPKAGEKW